MSDERWKALLSFIQFVLGTVIVGGFASYINSDIQRREVEIKEQDQISKNLGTVLSPNIADRLLMAEYYAAVTRSDDIRTRWVAYRDQLSKQIEALRTKSELAAAEIKPDTDAKVIDQKRSEIQRIEAQITPGAAPPSAEAVVPRVYFHIVQESDRERASQMAEQLSSAAKVQVPGIQRVSAGPGSSELRYFKLSEAVEAEAIARELSKLGPKVSAKYIAGFESAARLRPRHYEVWLAKIG